VIAYEDADGPQVPGVILGSKVNANILTVRDKEGGIIVISSPSSSVYPAAVGGYARRAVPNGMFGHSSNGGAGVVGWGSGSGATGVHARGTRANIEMFADGDAPKTRTDAHEVGELVTDSAGELWYCVVAGSPGSWRKLAGPMTTGAMQPIAPKRVYDSRAGQAPLSVAKGKLTPGSTRVIDCTVDAPEVPSDATAVMLNLTAANTTGLGNLTVYPDGSPAPTTSSINFTGGVNIANGTMSGCGPGAKVKVLAGGNTAADFIIDIIAYL
jgi:hypothetical protein